ncbi:hypothetical protein F4801DRAFT_274123 [Xylaria longipes]|nr:hypothetical protein F4801DRAFT_274123 [Xylaria longipes]
MMSSASSLFQALLVAIALRPASCSFSLDTLVTDTWYYVHNHLASTTSATCLAAYAAPIDCDVTLLGLVSSESPNFNPGPDDLERTCVPSCADSLDTWVQNVKKACNQEGDAALVETARRPYPEVPVTVVGEVFQYEYAWACSKNSSGWCYFNYPSSREWAQTDFTCTNECASQFFANAHNLPGSQYLFSVYELVERSSWWENQWAEGWQHLQECRRGSMVSTSSFSSSTSTSAAATTATTTTTTTTAGSIVIETASWSTPTSSSEPSSSTPTPTGNAGERLRVPSVFGVLAWLCRMI